MSDYEDRRYKPLSPWAYFFYSILFAVPVLGFALLIVFSLSGSNYNRQNFARSYWCIPCLILSILAILLLVAVFLAAVCGIRLLPILAQMLPIE